MQSSNQQKHHLEAPTQLQQSSIAIDLRLSGPFPLPQLETEMMHVLVQLEPQGFVLVLGRGPWLILTL
jgi:hypothetical protein